MRTPGGLTFAFGFHGPEYERYTEVFDSKAEALAELRTRAALGLDRLSMAVPFSGGPEHITTVADTRHPVVAKLFEVIP